MQKMMKVLFPSSSCVLFRKSLKTSTTYTFSDSSCIRSAEFNFKQQNSRKRPPRQRANLKDPKTVAYLGLALAATVAAPKIINDIIDFFEVKEDDEPKS